MVHPFAAGTWGAAEAQGSAGGPHAVCTLEACSQGNRVREIGPLGLLFEVFCGCQRDLRFGVGPSTACCSIAARTAPISNGSGSRR